MEFAQSVGLSNNAIESSRNYISRIMSKKATTVIFESLLPFIINMVPFMKMDEKLRATRWNKLAVKHIAKYEKHRPCKRALPKKYC